jgi:hypothetical protein
MFTEFFPILCGIGIGLLMGAIPSIRLRHIAWIGLSFLSGLVANLISGEARTLLLFDILVVSLCACAIALLRNAVRKVLVSD